MIAIFKIFHLVSLFVLVALTGLCLSTVISPQLREYRKQILMYSGIASLVVFLSGFGMLGMMKLGVPSWAIVKVLCWLALSAIGGIALRRPEKSRMLLSTAGAAALVAVIMAVSQPTL